MKVQSEIFGYTKDNKQVNRYTLQSKKGIKVSLINYGASIQELWTPDKNDESTDIVLGFDKLEAYENHRYFSGAIVGRFANRIANGQFSLNGTNYQLACNIGKHHLHGGNIGFGKKIWQAELIEEEDSSAVAFTYFSVDGEENYPGNLTAKVTYTLHENGDLQISYQATTDKDTIINLTNHAYFNLEGAGNGNVLSHELLLNANAFTPVNKNVIPNGEISSVKDTPFDFTQPKPIGRDISMPHEQLEIGSGFDHNFVIDKPLDAFGLIAQVRSIESGRFMEILGTHPGVQLYTANFLEPEPIGKQGKSYHKRNAFCLETQSYPDAPNYAHFPSCVLRAGEVYQHKTLFKFAVSTNKFGEVI
ncbi:MAG: aldose epimerase family protein [Bacteroidota bacterium]